jgi:hypothetical protein
MYHCTWHSRDKNIRRGTKKRARRVPIAVTVVVFLCLVIVISCYFVGYFATPHSAIEETNDNSLRVALIDALYTTYPNENFTRSVDEILTEIGFEVDIFQGNEVTVDFLKKLKNGYELIIFRMHSALSSSKELYLFTAEPYSAGKYTQEQYFRIVKEAYATEGSQSVFAVNWGFIKRLMTGKFNGALIIAMGCDGALDPWLAQEFVNQGAIGYVAWNGPVLLSHSDRATPYFIQALYKEGLTLEEAVEKTNNQIGSDPSSGAVLDCYLH